MSAKEPPRPRAAYAEFQALPTRWNDNDQFGHLYNATYFELFDEAMNLSLAARGILGPRDGRPIPVVVENGCTYFREVSYPERLEIGVRIGHLGRTSFRVEMGMFRAGDDVESARSHFAMVIVDDHSRRPVEITPEQREMLAALRVD